MQNQRFRPGELNSTSGTIVTGLPDCAVDWVGRCMFCSKPLKNRQTRLCNAQMLLPRRWGMLAWAEKPAYGPSQSLLSETLLKVNRRGLWQCILLLKYVHLSVQIILSAVRSPARVTPCMIHSRYLVFVAGVIPRQFFTNRSHSASCSQVSFAWNGAKFTSPGTICQPLSAVHHDHVTLPST